MLISQYQSQSVNSKTADGEKKWWLRTKGRREPEKDAYSKTPRLLDLCAGSHHSFSLKIVKKTKWFFVGPPPPSSIVFWRGFTRKKKHPFQRTARGLCAVP